MTYALGLDFGTTFTAAAVARDGSVDIAMLGSRSGAVPAIVFVGTDGSLFHGEDAFLRGNSEPLGLVHHLKRSLGDSTVVVINGQRHDPASLVASHLQWAIDRVTAHLGDPPTALVLTHPASWGSSRLDRFRRAIDLLDIEPDLLTEPHAAAVFHAETYPLAVGDLVAAYDLGGGTFDAAVLRRTRHGFELAGPPEGEAHLGGLDFDDVVLHLVQSRVGDSWKLAESVGGRSFQIGLAGLRQECVLAKEYLSDESEVDIAVVLPGISTKVTITRRELEHLIRPSIEESIGSFRRAVAGAGASVSDLSAVLMVGGSCRLPIVRDLLRETVGSEVALRDADPRHAVARGAAVEAAELLVERHAADALPEPPPRARIDVAPPVPPSPPSFELPAVSWSPPTDDVPGLVRPTITSDRRHWPRWIPVAAAAVVLISLAVPLVRRIGRSADPELSVQGQTVERTTTTPASPPEAPGETTDVGVSTRADAVASDEGMVAIPAGAYTVGVPEPGLESVAEFTVEVEAFHIDQFEVTNDQYLAFVQQVGAPTPLSWPRGVAPEALGEHPVTGVDFVWADAYCEALDKRLPGDAEWEVAARGPDGMVYPGDATPEALGLDIAGSRPVGSNPANVSGFGVFDSVGGVWEWVDEPYAPIDPNMRVRRGGQNGRVRDGAAMRQVVDPKGQATIIETGFRCAATATDPTIPQLAFDVDHERPSIDDDASGPQDAGPVDTSGLVNDSFDNTGSGFVTLDEGAWRVGYHAPSWYHVEAAQANSQVASLGGYNLADGEISLSVYIDKIADEVGEFRYGLVFRAGDELEDPPVGIAGPPRPTVYYAFVINPRAGVWELIHEDELPQRVQASGPLPAIRMNDATAPDVLGVEANGSTVVLSVNDVEVGTFDTHGFHIGAGNLGLYVETFDETLVHAHFDLLTVDMVR